MESPWDWDVVDEALRYIKEPNGKTRPSYNTPSNREIGTNTRNLGLSASWDFKVDSANFHLSHLSWLQRLARLYVMASTMGMSKLMLAVTTALRNVIKVMSQWLPGFAAHLLRLMPDVHVQCYGRDVFVYIERACYYIHQVVGCIGACHCSSRAQGKFNKLGGVKENRRCGYSPDEPLEIKEGRQCIQQMVGPLRFFEEEVRRQRRFEIRGPATPWLFTTVTKDFTLPPFPPTPQGMSTSGSELGRNIAQAFSTYPISIGHHELNPASLPPTPMPSPPPASLTEVEQEAPSRSETGAQSPQRSASLSPTNTSDHEGRVDGASDERSVTTTNHQRRSQSL